MKKSEVKKLFDFRELGIDYLELRATFISGKFEKNYDWQNQGKNWAIFEEPPQRRMIQALGDWYQVWTPWIYHVIDITYIDTVYWEPSRDHYKIGAMHKRMARNATTLPVSGLFNTSGGGVCYDPPETEDLEGLSWAQKIATVVGTWWASDSNLDMDFEDLQAYFPKAILQMVYKKYDCQKNNCPCDCHDDIDDAVDDWCGDSDCCDEPVWEHKKQCDGNGCWWGGHGSYEEAYIVPFYMNTWSELDLKEVLKIQSKESHQIGFPQLVDLTNPNRVFYESRSKNKDLVRSYKDAA